jgi:hypothetical protein
MDRLSAMGFRTLVTFAVAAAFMTLPLSDSTATAITPWTLAQAPSPASGWSAVDFLHGRWIALSHAGVVAVSSDGSTWSEQSAPVGSWQASAYGAGRYVALSSADVVPNEMVSSDGVAWSTLPGPPGTPYQSGHPVLYGQWTSVAFGHGLFVAVSSVGTVATSADGVTWVRRFWRPADDFTSITYGDGRFIAVDATQGEVLMSLDGLHWSLTYRPLTGPVPAPAAGLHLGAVAYGNGNFVAFGASSSGAGYVATSVHGYYWTLHQYSPAQAVAAATYGCGSFVAAGQSAAASAPIISSSTGSAWASRTVATGTASNWTGVAYGAGRYVAVDGAGDIASSPSGANCAAKVPSTPQQVSGNVHNGEVWTYMHPPASPGGAPVTGYRVAITDGVTTKYCGAPVYYQPNCIIRGLHNHKVYWVTAQAYNRFGYSAPTDPEFVIPVAAWSLDATAPHVVAGSTSTEVHVTGIIANSLGFYPWTTVSVHFGSRLATCRPSPFGECVVTVANPPAGVVRIYATYSGYGHSYRSLSHEVQVALG